MAWKSRARGRREEDGGKVRVAIPTAGLLSPLEKAQVRGGGGFVLILQMRGFYFLMKLVPSSLFFWFLSAIISEPWDKNKNNDGGG